MIRFNTLRPRQNGRHVADNIFKCIFLNENIWIPINISSLNFVPHGLIDSQYGSIGSDNGLAPTRRQAIIWTNDGQVWWRVYASLGLNELNDVHMYRPGHRCHFERGPHQLPYKSIKYQVISNSKWYVICYKKKTPGGCDVHVFWIIRWNPSWLYYNVLKNRFYSSTNIGIGAITWRSQCDRSNLDGYW